VATVGPHHYRCCSVAEAVPETIVKVSLDSAISAVVGTETVPVVAPAGTVTVTFC
jgi:hypothetical protein